MEDVGLFDRMIIYGLIVMAIILAVGGATVMVMTVMRACR